MSAPTSTPWARGISVGVDRTLPPTWRRVWLSGRGPVGSLGWSRGNTGGLPTTLSCRSASMTLWRSAAACPLMPGCTASSVAPRCPKSSPLRATTCVWSSSQTTRSPSVASEPTSSQVCGSGSEVTGCRGQVWAGSQPLGHPPTPLSTVLPGL